MRIERSYHELMQYDTFLDRYNYLKLSGRVGEETFGVERYLNQMLYRSRRWRRVRDEVIIRDNGCDLGFEGYDIYDKIIVHHLNPISIEDVENDEDYIYDPEYLICCSKRTHDAIHYGDQTLLPAVPIERRRNDTCPWK